MTPSRSLRQLRPKAAMLVMVSAIAVAGCQQKTASFGALDPMNTASTAPASFRNTAELGKAWQADQTNVNKGVAYANGLEGLGQTDRQLEVLARVTETNPANMQVAALYGKKLVASGRASDALPLLERAAESKTADWRVLSALGSAYDQQSLYEKARDAYKRALALDGNNLSVLNNLGMSFALEGNLQQAEITLRQANALPRARSEPRLRQNLALVVGLQGRFEDASKLASEDLPPDQVEANMAYLKKMLSQPNTWQQLSDGNQG